MFFGRSSNSEMANWSSECKNGCCRPLEKMLDEWFPRDGPRLFVHGKNGRDVSSIVT